MIQRLRVLFGLIMFGLISGLSFGQTTVFFPPNTTNPSCNGSSNGSIVFDIQGDSTDIFFNWSGGNLPTNENPISGQGIRRQTSLRAGTYSIFILDLNSGLDTTVDVVLTNPNPISVNGGNDLSSCLGSAINLTATTNAAQGSIITWSYTNANGPQTLTGNSTVIPASPSPLAILSNTNINVLLTDPSGCTATDIVRVTINPTPVGSANPTSLNICSGALSTSLSANLPNTTFIWSVVQSGTTGAAGGSGSAINQNVRATGVVNGTATYTIRPIAAGCFGSPFQVVATIRPKPVASALPDSTQICSGLPTNFSLSSNISNSSFAWRANPVSVTGSSNSSGSVIQQTLVSGLIQGKVVYRVAATANGCLSDSIRVVAVVKPKPTISVAPTDTINVCSGNTASFTYGVAPLGSLISWTVGTNSVGATSGTGVTNSQLYTNTTSLTQRATFSVVSSFNGCSSDVRQARVRVRPLPRVSFLSTKDTVCNGTPVNITLSSSLSGINTFGWTSTATGASGNTNPGTGASITDVLNVTGNGLGSVTYRAIATKDGCPGPAANKTVFVNPAPTALVTPQKRVICSGGNSSIIISSPVSGTSFSWTINPGTITGASVGTGNQINQTLVNPGVGIDSVTYSILPTLRACPGNIFSAVVLVRGKVLPTVSNPNPTLCSGGRLLINITSPGSFSWLVSGNGVSGAIAGSGNTIDQTLSLSSGSVATINYKIFGLINGCNSDTLVVPVTINRNPDLTLVSSVDSICPGQNAQIQIVSNPSDNATISWTAVSTNVSGASNGTGNEINQTLNLITGNLGKAKYNVSVSRFGCTDTASDSVFVRIPAIPFTATPSTTLLCTGNSVQIVLASIQNNVSYSWTVSASDVSGASAGTGNLINQTLNLTGSGPGFVDYIITPTSGGCSGLSKTIRINLQTSPNKPIITVSGGTSPICPGNSLTLTSDQVFGNQWTLNGIPIPAPIGNQRTLIANDSGVYRVIFTQSQVCVATSDPFNLQFFATPVVPVITGNPGFCPGGNSRLRSSKLTGNQWQINGADIPGATDSIFVASLGGVYTVRTRLETCPATSAIFTVTAFPTPPQPDITGNNFLCAGDSGLLTSTSAAAYQWIFNNNPIASQTNQTLVIKLGGGNYQVRITDGNTCSSTSNIFNVQAITANPTPTITGILEFCSGDSTILTTNNVNPAWRNQWFLNGILLPQDTFRTVVAKIAGTYTVTLKSPRGCVSTSLPAIVTERPLPQTPVISGLSLLCPGGSVNLTSTATTGNIWFLNGIQIPGANDQTFSAQNTGNYTVTVTDGQGCKAVSNSFEINSTTDISTTATLTDPTTCGAANGSILVTTNGGSGQYAYVWSPVTGGIIQAQEDQNAVSAGSYSVQVTDRLSGCSQVISGIVLNDQAVFSATAQVTNVTSCSGANGRINLTITGSNGPFTFVWTGPVGGTTQNLTNVPSGIYTVAIKEINSNCTFILDSIKVNSNVPPKPQILASGPLEFCAGDSIVLSTPSGGPYQWARIGGGALAGQTFDSLVVKTSGLYYVRVENPGFPNCFSRSDTLNIVANPLPENPSISASNSAVCQGISVSLTTTSTFGKQWLLNGNEITGASGSFLNVTAAGTYCLKVTDGNGCSRVSSTCRTITINPIPPAAVITGNPGFCPGASTVLTAIPFDSTQYNYTWLRNNDFVANSNRSQLTIALAGWYKVRVLNEATGCRTFGDSVFITNFNNPPAPTISGSSSICSGISSILVSSQAATYQWSRNGNLITGAINDTLIITQSGAYTVSITDFNGCGSTSASFTVSEIASPIASTITGAAAFCAGSSSILTASTNANYQWLFNGIPLSGQTGQTISASLFGDYTVVVANSQGCSDTSLVFATVQSVSNFSLDTTITGTSCQNGLPQNNGQIQVTTIGGLGTFSYTWTPALPPTSGQINLPAGTYAVLVKNQTTGCEVNLQNLIVTPTPTLAIVPAITNDSRCDLNNGSISVNVSGGSGIYTFAWTSLSSTTNSVNNLGAGNYEVFITDVASGCAQSFDSLIVSGVDTFTVTADITQPTNCGGVGLISISTNGGSGDFNFLWSGSGTGIVPGQAIQPNLTAGNYAVIVTDTNSKCVKLLNDLVLNPGNNLNINILATNPTSCGAANGTASAAIGVSGGSYLWTQISGGTFSSTDSAINGLIAGTYKVRIGIGSCVDSAEITLNQGTLGLSAASDSADCNDINGVATISSANDLTGAIFAWTKIGNPGFTGSGISQNNLSSGTYKVVVVLNSCRDSIQLVVSKKINCPPPVCTLSVSATKTDPTACGLSNGQANAIISNGTNPSISWRRLPSATVIGISANLSNLGTGTYQVIVNEGLCADTAQVTLTAPGAFTISAVQDSATCADNDGSINLTVLGASTAVQFSWTKIGTPSFTANTQNISNLSSGTYKVVVTDGACKDSIETTVLKPANCGGCTLSISAVQDSATCADNDGSINLTVLGASTAVQFSWTKIGTPSFTANTQNISNLSSGTYKVVVIDGACKDSTLSIVKKPFNCGGCNLQVVASSTPVTCAGVSNGTAFAFITSGGVGPFKYTLNGNQEQTLPDFLATFNNQPAGPFSVAVKDETTLCTDTVEGIIGAQLALSASAFTQNPSCSAPDGSIRVVVSGSSGPYTITLGPQTLTTNDGDTIFTGLTAGAYSVSITSALGCAASISNIVLIQPQVISLGFGEIKPASCNGNADGSIVVSTISGSSEFAYFIPNETSVFQTVSPGDTIKNLKAGTYQMTIRGLSACDLDTSFIIPGPGLVDLQAVSTGNSACQDSTGTARMVSISGGNGAPWTYRLFLDNGLFQAGNLPADSVFKDLAAGDYTLILFDSNACNDTARFSILTQTSLPLVSISADKQQICSGDTVSFSAANLANIALPQYAWYLNGKPLNVNTSTFRIDSLKNGDSVQVKLTGIPQCLNPDSAWSNSIKVNIIPSNLQALAGIDPIKVQACIGQFATLKALNINNLPNVGYRWIVNGVQLPTDTNQTLILFPGLPVNTVRAVVFSRLISNCIIKQSDTSGIQQVTQIESFTASTSISQISPASGQVICPNTPVRFGVQTNLKGKVDFKVQWWRNDTLISTTVDTFFTFNGLVNGALIQAVAIFDTTLTCVPSNFGKGQDSTATLNISVLPAGDIRCRPCSLQVNVTPSNINCAGGATGSITAQASGGSGRYNYSLLPNGPSNQPFPFFFGLTPGTYSVLVKDSVTACSTTVSGVNIIVQNAYTVSVSSTNPTPCIAQADGKLEFVAVTDASGDLNKYKFRIRPADPYTTTRLFTGLPAGTYTMEVIDTISGCFTQNVRTLTAPGALQAQVSITSLPLCYGQFNGQIRLDTVRNGSGLYQYSLSGDSGTYSTVGINNPIPQGFGAGQVQLFFKDLQTGCLDTALVNISQPDSLKLSAGLIIESQCFAPTGQIKLLEFSGGAGDKKLEVKLPGATVFLPVTVPADSILINLAGGDYVFQITDTNNCSKQFIVNLPSNSPRAQQVVVVKPCIGDTNGIVRLSGLTGGTKPYNFTINDEQGQILKVQTDSVFSQLKPGTYGITVNDASTPGCEVKYVRVVQPPDRVSFNVAGITPSTCENFDGKIKFTFTGGQPGFKYSFDSIPNVFTVLKSFAGDTLTLSGLSRRAAGNPYTLRLTDSGPGAGCAYDTSFNIPGNSPLRFKFSLKNVKCFGENSGSVLIDSLNGTGPVTLKVVEASSGTLVKQDSIPGNIFFNNKFEFGGLPAGQFNLIVQQYGACQASRVFPISLTQPTQINIAARQYKSSANGFAQGSILLDTVKGSVAPYLVSFDEGSFFSYKPDTLFGNLNPGKYTILVQDSIGCEVSKELEIEEDTQLFIPTLFTPNGDGLNDIFVIRNLPPGSKLNVRSRWGEEVFNSGSYNNDWDAKGIQPGTYFYTLKIPNVDEQNGWLEIQR